MDQIRPTYRQCGAVMTEMIFIMPALLLILSLLFYTGAMSIREQHATVMARYETWRDADSAPGPFWSPEHTNRPGNEQMLNDTFYAGQANRITHTRNDNNFFAEDALDDMITAANNESPDARLAVESILFRPPNQDPRLPHGHLEGFQVEHEVTVPLWREVNGPIRRWHVRMSNDWRYTTDWRAGPDTWKSTAHIDVNHLRGVRDAFFEEFDKDLDDIDGERDPEYSDYANGPQVPNGSHLAGAIREMYLRQPPYRGPIVHDELEQENSGSGSW